jgi:hypothetical protein
MMIEYDYPTAYPTAPAFDAKQIYSNSNSAT